LEVTSFALVEIYQRKGRLRAFSKEPLLKSWGITHLEQKPAKNNDGTAKRTPSLKVDVLQMELLDSPMCCRCE